MKSNFWFFGGLAWLAAASAFAQTPARDSNAPAVSRFVAGPLAKDTVLDPPWTATVKSELLIVRTQPAFAGDILTHVVKGQTLTVLEQIALAKPKLNEPTNWARIILPTNASAWVFADYINTNTMTVTARRVNVRGGPSDAYGVVGLLEKGATVKQVGRNTDWIKIEPPANACGFVASDFLTMQPPAAPPPALAMAVEPAAATPTPTGSAPAPTATEPVASAPITPEPVAPVAAAPVATAPVTPEPVAPASTNTTNETNTTYEATNTASVTGTPPPIVAPEPVATTLPAATAPTEPATAPTPVATAPATTRIATAPVATTPAPTPAVATPEPASGEPKPRVVTREGFVHKSLNVKAPTDYELREVSSKEVIEYLLPDAQDKTLKKFVGARVFVTGTEWLDPLWPKTPILRIQTVDPAP